MAAHLYRTRAMLQIPRAIPALIARTQATQSTQSTPTAGKGIPTPGNFNAATPPSPSSSNTTGSKSTPPFGKTAGSQSFWTSPTGITVGVSVLAIGAYAGYKYLYENKEESKGPKDKKDSGDQQANKAKGGDAHK